MAISPLFSGLPAYRPSVRFGEGSEETPQTDLLAKDSDSGSSKHKAPTKVPRGMKGLIFTALLALGIPLAAPQPANAQTICDALGNCIGDDFVITQDPSPHIQFDDGSSITWSAPDWPIRNHRIHKPRRYEAYPPGRRIVIPRRIPREDLVIIRERIGYDCSPGDVVIIEEGRTVILEGGRRDRTVIITRDRRPSDAEIALEIFRGVLDILNHHHHH